MKTEEVENPDSQDITQKGMQSDQTKQTCK